MRRSALLRPGARYFCEPLEIRRLLSTITWVNRGSAGGTDSDNFNAVFGTLATQARTVIDADISYWERVIDNFNYSDGTDTYKLTINMAATAQGAGSGGVGANTSQPTAFIGTAPNNKPSAATITIGWRSGITAGTNSAAGWYLDPTPFDNSEFQGTLQNAFTEFNSVSLGGADLLTGIMHEIGHAMGLYAASSQIKALSTNTGVTDTLNTPVVTPVNTNTYWLFKGPSVSTLWTSYDSGGASGGASNAGGAQHAAPSGASATVNGVTYVGNYDLMNAFFSNRSTMSDNDVLMLKDAYGYSVSLPDTFGTFYDTVDSSGLLRITGTSGADTITVSATANAVSVSMELGSPVAGIDPTGFFTSTFFTSVTSIQINSLGGGDNINILQTGSIAVTISGGGGANLDVDGAFGTTIVGANSIVGSGQDIPSIAGVANVTLTGTTGNDVFNVQGEPDTGSFVLDGSLGDDTINFDTSGHDDTTLLGNDGNDIINFEGSGTLVVDGGTGTDELEDDPFFIGDQYGFGIGNSTLTNTDDFASVSSGTVNYSNIESLSVTGGNLDDIFDISSTPGPTTVNGGNGNDTFVLGNLLVPVPVISNLTFNGGAGIDTLSLDDLARTGGGTYSIGTGTLANATNVTGPGFNYLYSGLEGVELTTGAGNNNITLGLATSLSTVSVFGGAGNDVMNYGSGGLIPSPTSVSFDGGGGTNTMVFNNGGAATDFNFVFNVSATTVSVSDIFGGGGFSYSEFQGLSVTGTGGADTFNVTSTAAGCPVTIVGDGGADVFNVSSTAPALTGDLAGLAAQLNITGGTGAVINVSEAGQTADDNVTVNEASGLLFSNTLGWSIHIPGNANTGGINFTAGAGDDLINVLSTFVGEPYYVNGGDGNDEIDVQMAGLGGPTTLDGGNGYDRFVADDPQNTSPSNLWAMNTNNVVLQRTTPALTTSFHYFNTEVAEFFGTPGVDTYEVQAANPGEGIQIDGEGGDDIYTVGDGTTSQVEGQVVIYGGDGGNDSLIVDDSADTTGRTFHIDSLQIGAAPGDDLFDGGGSVDATDIFAGITIKCGSGPDTIYAVPNSTSPLTIQGNDPTTFPGDSLNLGLADAQNPLFTPGGTGAGSYTFDNLQPLAYTGIESVTTDDIVPAVIDSDFEYDVATQSVLFQFNKDVSSFLSPSFLSLTNNTTDQTFNAGAVTFDNVNDIATFTFPQFANGVLPDGNYTATLQAGLEDSFGNTTDESSELDFFFLGADANRDRAVNASDFDVLASNYGSTGVPFSQGDFNYDGIVDTSDFNILAANFNVVLAPPAAVPLASTPALRASSAATPNLFASSPISSLTEGDSLLGAEGGKLISSL